MILVDNGSPDDSASFFERYAAEHDNVRVVLNGRNAGFAAGCNLGLALSRGDALLLLNNDTLVTPGWLGRLRAPLDADASVGATGPRSNNVSGPQMIEDTAYGDPYADPAGLDAFAAAQVAAHAGETAAAPRVVGFCLLARRDAIERIGGLEERFGPGNFEDDDLCLRIQATGLRRAHRARLVRAPRGQPHVCHSPCRLDTRDDPQLDDLQGALGPRSRDAARGRLRDPARAGRAARALRPAPRARRHAHDRRRPRLPRGLAARRAEARRRCRLRQRGDRAARGVRRGGALGRPAPPLPDPPPPGAGRLRQPHHRRGHARGRRGRARRRARGQPARAGAAERARCSLLRNARRTLGRAAVHRREAARPDAPRHRREPRRRRATWPGSRVRAPTATRACCARSPGASRRSAAAPCRSRRCASRSA